MYLACGFEVVQIASKGGERDDVNYESSGWTRMTSIMPRVTIKEHLPPTFS